MPAEPYFSEVIGRLGNENEPEVSQHIGGANVGRGSDRNCRFWKIDHICLCFSVRRTSTDMYRPILLTSTTTRSVWPRGQCFQYAMWWWGWWRRA